MRTHKIFLSNAIALAITINISGCGQSPNSAYDKSHNDYASDAPSEVFTESVNYAMPKQADEPMGGKEADEESPSTQIIEDKSASHELQSGVVNQTVANKKLLINITAQFEVENVEDSVSHIEKITQEAKGYIALSRINNNQYGSRQIVQGDKIININRYVREAEMTVRVPKTTVNSFLKSLQKEIKFLQFSEFTAQDVTLDIQRQQLQSQLRGEQASELQEQRLKAKKANDQDSNVESINSTYDAKNQQALADIERRAIEDKLQYSTIQLSFTQPEALYQSTQQNIEEVIKAHEPSLGEQLKERLADGWITFKQVILGGVQLWWLWLMLLFSMLLFKLIGVFWRWIGRKMFSTNKKKKIKKPANTAGRVSEAQPQKSDDTDDTKDIQ